MIIMPALYLELSRVSLEKRNLQKKFLQDVFLKIWERIDSYDASKGKLFTWMLNIARNQAIDKTRSKEFSKGKKTGDIDNYVNRIENEGYVEQKVEGDRPSEPFEHTSGGSTIHYRPALFERVYAGRNCGGV